MPTKHYTLIFIKTDTKLLLGKKKRGFGVGMYNGYGGKLENNETIIECALRELEEESGLVAKPENLKYLGYVLYKGRNEEFIQRLVYIFVTKNIYGVASETDEMSPEWFDFERLPYERMWPDAKEWFHLVVKEEFLKAMFVVDEENNVVEGNVEKLDCVPNL